MKKMKQKIISLILTVVMICAMLPVTAFAAGTVAKIGDVKYATLDEAVRRQKMVIRLSCCRMRRQTD